LVNNKEFNMGFAQQFVEQLKDGGFSVEARSVPERAMLASDLTQLTQWLDSLDEDTRNAVDGVTADFNCKYSVADPQVAIAPTLSDLLSALDEAPVSLSVTDAVSALQSALDKCDDGTVA
jgi:hypothetical protein